MTMGNDKSKLWLSKEMFSYVSPVLISSQALILGILEI